MKHEMGNLNWITEQRMIMIANDLLKIDGSDKKKYEK